MARAEVDFLASCGSQNEEVRLSAVIVESPRLMAESDPAGMNLSRALAPRQKAPPRAPPKPKTDKEGWGDPARSLRAERCGRAGGARLTGPGGKETLHLEGLQSFMSLRYASGNGSTDLDFRLDGRSVLAPVGPLAIKAEARVRRDETHFNLDGQLLGGTLQARGDVDSNHLDAADAVVAIAIPRTELGDYGWGPLQVDGQARPGTIPKLDLLLAIPGLELTARGGQGGGADVFKLDARLALEDLSRTGKAAQALTPSVVPSMAGHGDLRLSVEGALGSAPGSLTAGCKGFFEHLRFAENTITDLAVDGHAAQLAKIPGEAELTVTVARPGWSPGPRSSQARQDSRSAPRSRQQTVFSVGQPGFRPSRLQSGAGWPARRRSAGAGAVAAFALLSQIGVDLGRDCPPPPRAAQGLLGGASPSFAGSAAGCRWVQGRRTTRRARRVGRSFASTFSADVGGPAGAESGRDARPRRQGQRRGGQSSRWSRVGGRGRWPLQDLLQAGAPRSTPRWPTRRSTGPWSAAAPFHGDERGLSPAGRPAGGRRRQLAARRREARSRRGAPKRPDEAGGSPDE